MFLRKQFFSKRFLPVATLSLACLLVSSPTVLGFDFDGSKWGNAEVEMFAGLTGTAASGTSWNTAFISAMDEWTEKTPFRFILQEGKRDPCIPDGANGVDFKPDLCGSEFGEKTLAVTFRRRLDPQLLGEPNISESDIIIRETAEFDVYNGRLRRSGNQELDFRRVVLHELGHVIGLDHEPDKPAIMAPSLGDLYSLQADDIAAVEELYGGLSQCTIQPLRYGVFIDALDASDCTVQELTAGSTDTSAIDIYGFELTSETLLEFTMTSSTLDSVLLLSDTNLDFIAFDDKSRNDCNSVLSQTLPPGSYFLHANTYDVPVKEACGNQGEYLLSATFISTGPIVLGPAASLLGSDSSASFSGGITGDNGQSYRNKFTAQSSLDITAQIEIDPQHQGQAGFMVVAALVGEQILFLNQQGLFVDSGGNLENIPRAANKLLSAVEQLDIATDLVLADLNIEEVVVNFYIAYGLNSNPSELYHNQTPLNLTVSP